MINLIQLSADRLAFSCVAGFVVGRSSSVGDDSISWLEAGEFAGLKPRLFAYIRRRAGSRARETRLVYLQELECKSPREPEPEPEPESNRDSTRATSALWIRRLRRRRRETCHQTRLNNCNSRADCSPQTQITAPIWRDCQFTCSAG